MVPLFDLHLLTEISHILQNRSMLLMSFLLTPFTDCFAPYILILFPHALYISDIACHFDVDLYGLVLEFAAVG